MNDNETTQTISYVTQANADGDSSLEIVKSLSSHCVIR